MANAIKVEMTVDWALTQAVPALRPLLGRRVELIALQEEAQAPVAPARRKLTVDELFAAGVVPPAGTPPLTEEDIWRAIIEGAVRGND